MEAGILSHSKADPQKWLLFFSSSCQEAHGVPDWDRTMALVLWRMRNQHMKGTTFPTLWPPFPLALPILCRPQLLAYIDHLPGGVYIKMSNGHSINLGCTFFSRFSTKCLSIQQ